MTRYFEKFNADPMQDIDRAAAQEDDWGELIEVVTYAPDGTVINRED